MMLLLTIFTYHLVNIKPASSLITIVSAILFTYHLVNIKLNKDKKDEAKTKKFTYHLVNIKLFYDLPYIPGSYDIYIPLS